MKLEDTSLTPAEIIMSVNNKSKVQELIKFTFYDLLLRNLIGVNQMETETSGDDFFIQSFSSKKGNIKDHEEIFIKIISKEEGLISFKKLVFELSNYGNEKFRSIMPEFIFEKIVLRSLVRSELFVIEKKVSFLIFRRREVVPTEKGSKIINAIRSVKNDYPANWLFIANRNFKQNSDFFESKLFLELDENFNRHFWDGIKNRHVALAYWGRGNYPKPQIDRG